MTEIIPESLTLRWQGPFTWFGDAEATIFAGECAETVGVYLWTVPIDGAYRVFYVGQTEAGFAYRHHQHFREYFGGAYSIYEPVDFAAGRLNRIYKGYAYRKPTWKHAAPFHEQFPGRVGPLVDHMRSMRFFIADLPVARRIQRRVETALMQIVYALPGEAGQLLEPGLKLEPRWEDEMPIRVSQEPVGLIEGLPAEFEA